MNNLFFILYFNCPWLNFTHLTSPTLKTSAFRICHVTLNWYSYISGHFFSDFTMSTASSISHSIWGVPFLLHSSNYHCASCDFIYPYVFVNSVFTINCMFPARALLQSIASSPILCVCVCVCVCVWMQTLPGLLSDFSPSSLQLLLLLLLSSFSRVRLCATP